MAAGVAAVVEALQDSSCGNAAVPPAVHNQAIVLQTAFAQIPNPSTHVVLKSIAVRLGQRCHKDVSKYFRIASHFYI